MLLHENNNRKHISNHFACDEELTENSENHCFRKSL